MEFLFERDAMKGEPLPPKLDIADSCLYMALKYLYAMYRKGLIDRKRATEEKNKIVYNWKADKSKIEALNRDNEALREKIGYASDAYKENPSLETADALYAALYNLPTDWRTKK
jgi:predicted transcriptional regulator